MGCKGRKKTSILIFEPTRYMCVFGLKAQLFGQVRFTVRVRYLHVPVPKLLATTTSPSLATTRIKRVNHHLTIGSHEEFEDAVRRL